MTKNTGPVIYNSSVATVFLLMERAGMLLLRPGQCEVKLFRVTYTLYADVILANNFMMDVLLLSLVKRMMNLETRKGGCILGGFLGAFYALTITIWPQPVFLEAILTYAAASSFMILAAFRIRKIREFLRAAAGLYLASCLAGGVMELFGRSGLLSSPWFYAGGALFSLGISYALWRKAGEGAEDGSHLYRVEVEYRGRKGAFTGFLDTGNRLTEPISGKPVCILSAGSAKELFGTLDKIFYIPFRSVGREEGLLPAVKAERMEIRQAGRRLVIKDPYIAISKEPVSRNDTYQILLNEKLWL